MRPAIEPKSDQINADDLIAGPMTVMITGVKVQGGVEQPVSISITGTSKVYRPCKSMSRVMVAAWGPDANVYVGRSMTLYRDPSVTWAGFAVGGIRISHMSDIDRDMMLMLTATKQKRAPHKIGVLRKVAPVHPALIAAEAAAAKMFEGEFTLDDFLDQLQQIKKMGSLTNVMGMLPGVTKEMKNAQISDDMLTVTEAIIYSMTTEERRKPEIINGSRRTRIAKGSGTQVSDVNKLVKQFSEMQKMMKRMGGMAGKGGKKGGPMAGIPADLAAALGSRPGSR
jgi:hypothetical protein